MILVLAHNMYIGTESFTAALIGITPTLDELFEVVTLIQTHRVRTFPVILVGTEYWSGLTDWIKSRLLEDKRISSSDLDIIQILDDPEEILDAVKKMVIL